MLHVVSNLKLDQRFRKTSLTLSKSIFNSYNLVHKTCMFLEFTGKTLIMVELVKKLYQGG